MVDMSMKNVKTNAMRILERQGISYEPLYYDLGDQKFSGAAVAELSGIPAEQSFKTLTARSGRQGIIVFVIPVNAELDLKLAAQAAGEKKIEMVAVKELLGLTGYIRGEVSPVGMKKLYPTFIDITASNQALIAVSAGKKGASMILAPQALATLLQARFVGLI